MRYFHFKIFSRNFSSHSRTRPIIVQKYGGTSLGTAAKLEKVLKIIEKFHQNNRLITVVSAFSSETKEEGTTSRLLSAAQSALKGDQFFAYKAIDAIEQTHVEIINNMFTSNEAKIEAHEFVNKELFKIKQFCESLAIIEELSPKSHDLIIGCGERLAAGVLSKIIKDKGLKSTYVDLSKAFPKGLDTTSRNYSTIAKTVFQSILNPIVEANSIPVVTGFFGQVKGGIISSVGRGYTDLTSALCAGALAASQLQVWKESDGVFTGNPTKISSAKLIHKVTPTEAAELTYFGNEVLHPFTMSCAMKDKVPVAILNTFKPEGMGTVISSEYENNSEILADRPGKDGITAICSKNGIKTLNLTSVGLLDNQTFLAQVFKLFNDFKIKADLISTSMNKLTITLHESTNKTSLQEMLVLLKDYAEVEVEEEKAIVSCIGQGMRRKMGLAAQVFKSLSDGGVNIEMIAQGASEINISVVVDGEDQNKAIHCLHKTFLE